MISAGDVSHWAAEGSKALKGAYVHRVWRTETTWVVLARHHENGDPDARAIHRVALEIALESAWARCVAVTPEWVSADDKKLKKGWSKDNHPFLVKARRQLGGCKIESLERLGEDRIAVLRCTRDEDDATDLGPRSRLLVVELIGRSGNLILCAQGAEGTEPVVVKALNAGRRGRPHAADAPYQAPPPRPGNTNETPTLAAEVAANAETLAVGLAVARHQRELEESEAQSSRHGTLARAARKAVKKSEGVLRKLEAQLAEVGKADEYEKRGDLIKTNLGSLPRQAAEVTVTDYTTPEPTEVVLKLDPTKTVQDAMKALYKKAKKLRKGEIHVLTRQGETDALLSELRAVAERLEGIDPEDDDALDAVEAELRRLKALPKAKAKGSKQKQQVNQGPRCFRSAEGHEILVGRSDAENDRLTMRIARGRDLFFHVKGCPGSHVILRVDVKRPPNHESLMDAAALAAYYSKARQRGTVDVGYTPRKWVKKPKGAKPGLVMVSNAKTLRVDGNGERVRRVLATLRRPEDDE